MLEGRLRVMVSVEGKEAISLIDTGAACTLIKESFWLTLCKDKRRVPLLKPVKEQLVTLTGEKLPVKGRTIIKLFDEVMEVIVTDKIKHDLLLGNDTLTVLNALIDCGNRVVTLKGNQYRCTVPDEMDLELGHTEICKWVEAFPDVFQENIGCTDGVHVYIDTGDHSPIRQRAYRIPLTRRQVVEEEVNKMLEKGVIRPSQSPWASPVTLVPKKDGSIRFCIDYRQLNAITRKDSYPLPRTQDIFDNLAGAAWFTSLDLKSGYWQIPVAECDIPKTAFITHNGLYEWVRMPFGLANAPSVFQREMQRVLGNALGKHAMVYIDDIVVFSKTEAEHEEHVRDILNRLQGAGLVVKREKCHFKQRQLPLLGYIVSGEGIAADPEKTRAISELKPPTNVAELRRFLGVTNYYRQLIEQYADIAAPLQYLIRKGVPWIWTDQCQTAFADLKLALVSSDVMAHPVIGDPYLLYTDASDKAIGAILVQKDSNGIERPIQYVSRALKGSELKWSTIEKEAYAIVNALKTLRPYLYGAEFVILTDHKPLKALFLGEVKNTKVQRWASLIAEYGAPIQHRAGKNNVRADMLSRIVPIEQEGTWCEMGASMLAHSKQQEVGDLDTVNWIDAEANPAEEVPWRWDGLDKMEVREKQQEMAQWELVEDDGSYFHRHDGLLWYTGELPDQLPYPRLVLPSEYRRAITEKAHAEVGHQGQTKTLQRLRESYYWPKQRETVRSVIYHCPMCRMNEPRTTRPEPVGMPTATYPGEIVGMDLVGPLAKSVEGNMYLLTLMDHATGWAEAYPISNRTGEAVVQKLCRDYIPRHGVPTIMIHDNGTEFTNSTVQDYLCKLGVEVRRTTPYHPQTNGKLERWHRSLKDILRKLVNNNISAWEEHLGSALLAYRQSVSETTGYSPFYLLYGRRARYPTNRAPEATTVLGQRLERMGDALHEACINTQKSKERYIKDAIKHANAVPIKVGDRVLPRAYERAPFDSKWDTPKEITRIRGNVVWCKSITGVGKTKVYNRDKLQLVSSEGDWISVKPRVTRYYRTRPQQLTTKSVPPQTDTQTKQDQVTPLPASVVATPNITSPPAPMPALASWTVPSTVDTEESMDIDISPNSESQGLRRSHRSRPWAVDYAPYKRRYTPYRK